MKSGIRLVVISLVCVAVALFACRAVERASGQSGPSAKSDSGWPQWRGANRDGKSPDKGLLKSWPDGGPKKLWELAGIGKGFSSVSLGGGMIYTAGHKDKKFQVTAVDMAGKVVWSKGVTAATPKGPKGSRSTPTYDNGNLYVEAGTGVVGCYDAKTGAEKWTRKFSEFGNRGPGWAFSESILIAGKLAIVTPGSKTVFMVALDKTTGKTVWKTSDYDYAHYASPIYVMHGKIPMIINAGRYGLIGIHAETGKVLWTNSFAAKNVANCPTPVYSDGYVFWAAGYGKGGICLKISKSGNKASIVYKTPDMVCHHGGFVLLDGYIYGNHNNGWSCLEFKTGKKQWSEKGVGKGSLCYADGMLYLFGERGGKAALAEASPKGMKITGEVSVSGSGPSWAHPVVVGGRLYLRYDDNLYCFDVKAK